METPKVIQHGDKSLFIDQNTGQITIKTPTGAQIINVLQSEDVELLKREFAEQFSEISAWLKQFAQNAILGDPTRRDKIFIFHNPADRAWVEKHLAPQLENADLPVYLGPLENVNEDWRGISRTVADCKATLLVFSGKFSRMEQGLIDVLLNERPKKLLALRLGETYVFEEFADPVSLEAGESRPESFRPLLARLQSEELPVWEPLDENFIEISAMPNGGEHIHLFGRQRELQILDDAWAKRDCRVLSFTAQGGTGKSALFNRWLADMGRDHFRGAGRVLATSFYSQGTGERVTSADQFINFALGWFGERDFEQRSPWDKGKRLAQLVSEHRTLLILDGLEPLQEGGAVDTGKVKDPALFTLIRDLAKRNEGLCIITSRLRLGGLERQAAGIRQEDLEQISDEAGKHILRFAGIRGDDAALAGAVRQFGNHAFAVNLLSVWLYAQPGHRVEAADAIADLPEVPQEYGRHPKQVIAAFEKLLREKGLDEEVRLLRFLGLFDRPVTEEAIAQLHPFQNLYKTLDNLWMLKLIYREKRHPILRKNKEDMVDCHPLVREHYSEVFAKEEPEIWQKCHAVLYEYYKGLPERLYGKFLPDTLEEMEPLFLAVRHGCSAGLIQASFDLYFNRMERENDSYLAKRLGALSLKISIYSHFFQNRWTKPVEGLRESDKSLLLGNSGFALRGLGRLSESKECFEAGLRRNAASNDWTNVAIGFSNISELSLTFGEVKEAINLGSACLKYAEMQPIWGWKMTCRCTLGDSLFQNGYAEDAFSLFREAEEILKKQMPKGHLFAPEGYRLHELLIDHEKYEMVIQRSLKTLDFATAQGGLSVLSTGLEWLSCGKALLRYAMSKSSKNDSIFSFKSLFLGNSKRELSKELADSLRCLNNAMDKLRTAGALHHLPPALLARAAYHRQTQNHTAAEADLEEVLDIAEPSGMRLHLTDYHLETARLRLAQDRPDDARPHITEAARFIEETGYHRRDRELEELQRAVVV